MKIASFLFLLAFTGVAFAVKVEVDIQGMSCGMCESHITKELKATEKVENISVSATDKKARFEEIKGKKISDVEIKAAIKKAGEYEAVKITRK